jgi:hypothetical protein
MGQWFANRGQILQLAATMFFGTVAAILSAKRAWPDLSASQYFTGGTVLFYALTGLMVATVLYGVRQIQRAMMNPGADAKSAPVTVVKAGPAQTAHGFQVLQVYPDRSTKAGLQYPLKLRVQAKNKHGEAVHVYNPRWIRTADGWPSQPPKIVKLREAKNAADGDSAKIAPNQDLFIWVGMDPSVTDNDIRMRRETRTLGALEVTVQKGSGEEHVRIPL